MTTTVGHPAAPERPKTRQEDADYTAGYYYACGRNDLISELLRTIGVSDSEAWHDPNAFAVHYMRQRWACRAGLTAYSPSVQDSFEEYIK